MLIYNLLHFPGDMILFAAAKDINCTTITVNDLFYILLPTLN